MIEKWVMSKQIRGYNGCQISFVPFTGLNIVLKTSHGDVLFTV